MAEFEEYDPSIYERTADVYDVMNAVRKKSDPDEAATVLRLIREPRCRRRQRSGLPQRERPPVRHQS